ncbi:hypothetical protein SCHPADRAFT_817568 [Schizopora paradoxa]|uniref:ferric-chelate reductase (NADPH) n=1 Tax=Schizopora paradoxa TaxID=27342 RepID=A0A0H2S6E6_9AGAM|nr:hypothetical protein SCHPADRAFT_817568 [Schizopora paradoxa]
MVHPILSRGASPSEADLRLKASYNHQSVEQLWLFLTAVVGLLTVINWSRRVWRFYAKRRAPGVQANILEKDTVEAVNPGRTGKVALRNTPSAFASLFRIVCFRTTIPIGFSAVASVSETAFILGYLGALFGWLFVNTSDAESFFFEDRAAHLASSQLALIVALAGKNNVLSYLTGVSHEKLNVLHRAAARSCLVLLWIHAITRSASGLPAKFDLQNGWMRCGVVGLAAFTIATILSLRIIRVRFFEFFFVTHLILIAIFLICGFIHAKDPGFGNYIWPALFVWGLERGVRSLKLVWNNRVWSRSDKQSRVATVEHLTSDTVRLTLRRHMHWKPGQHAYVILPSVSKLPTEAHPFTISSIPHSLDGVNDHADKDLVFLIRGRSGFTQRLLEHAGRKGSAPTVPALIDGPYGSPPDLSIFSTCILFAGGSGVSYTLPLLMDLVRRARSGTSSVQRIFFVWVIKEPQHLAWIASVLSTAVLSAPSTLEIDSRIHVTGKSVQVSEYLKNLDYENSSSSSSESASRRSSESYESKKTETIPYTAFKTKEGRPDVHRIIEDAVTMATGPVSVDVAGPAPLAHSVRAALTSEITSPIAVLKGRQPVTLHVETFGMVKG